LIFLDILITIIKQHSNLIDELCFENDMFQLNLLINRIPNIIYDKIKSIVLKRGQEINFLTIESVLLEYLDIKQIKIENKFKNFPKNRIITINHKQLKKLVIDCQRINKYYFSITSNLLQSTIYI
jgi:hypothetical protein